LIKADGKGKVIGKVMGKVINTRLHSFLVNNRDRNYDSCEW